MPTNQGHQRGSLAQLTEEERPFLEAVFAQRLELEPRRVYADWLAERGDARSALLRAMCEVLGGGPAPESLPSAEGISASWLNLIGWPFVEHLVACDGMSYLVPLMQLARPAVQLLTTPADEAELALGASKFGGHPDLPLDVVWPSYGAEQLTFLGQLDMADVAGSLCAQGLPTDGLLSLFAVDADGLQPGYFSETEGPATRLIYTPSGAALQRRPSPLSDATEGLDLAATNWQWVRPACRLTFIESWDLPSSHDRLTEAEGLAQSALGQYDWDHPGWKALDELRTRLGGYGNHLLGYPLDQRGGDPGPGAEWLSLICLDSDDHVQWNWCDGEHLTIFVRDEDVATGCFTRVEGRAC